MEWMGYLATLLMGITLGLVGGGGSILTVPILVYLFGIAPVLATAYSLFIVGSTSLLGGWGYHRRGDVDWRTGFTFAAPSFIGVYLTRAYLMPRVPDPIWQSASVALSKPILIMGVFAALMLLASWSMLRSPQASTANKAPTQAPRSLHKSGFALIALEGLLVGGVTGFVGAGGGFLIIPALVILVGLPMRVAVGTSLIIIAVKSLLGFLGDVQTQANLQWGLLLSLSAVALVGMALGLKLAPRVPEAKLKRGFGWMVLLMGALIMADQLRQMSNTGSGN
ncbi:MAG TPA: sulfite exporter TauE/SafE family protein [Pseudobdellovibrionaceae bacterium]|nr:sulfite exporter TauE/SafE family protein [Pseudobdellovibrionaceae bacterium]